MSVVTKVDLTENVAIVSFENAPAHIGFLAKLFDRVAKAGVNVDMISQTAPKGESNTISFTVSCDKLTEVLQVVNSLKAEEKDIVPLVSTGNVKLCLYGGKMPEVVGVASDAFLKLKEKNIDILLITTSDFDISIVVTAANADLAYDTLKKAYEI